MPALPRKKNEEKSETLGECVHAGRSALGGSTAASRPRGLFSDQREGDAPPPAVPCDHVRLSPPLGSEGTRVSRGYEEHASLGVTSAGNMPRARIHCDGRPRCGSLAGSTKKLGAFMCPHFRVLKCSFGSSVLWGRAGGEAELGVGGHRAWNDGPSPRDSAGGEALASGFILGPPDVIYKQPPGQGTR